MFTYTFCITQLRAKTKNKRYYDTDLDQGNNTVHREIMDCIMIYKMPGENGHLEENI